MPPSTTTETTNADTPFDTAIVDRVTAWPGVTAQQGGRGELSLRLGRRELGHLHGDRVAHFSFPKALWAELMASERVVAHPIDRPGLAARALREPADVDEAVALMRLNYDRANAAAPAGGPRR